jgi:dTDP-6-deoxy-L-talose 4-dehydrogenase (NAD+)
MIKMSAMRVLVTGAGGFIGTHLVRWLAAANHHVVAVDRSAEALARIAADVRTGESRALDLADQEATRRLLADFRPDALVHLAWYANPTDYLTSKANLASLSMTTGLIDAALTVGCRKIVVGGSCVEYAVKDGLLRESDATNPRTLYAACKRAACQVAQALAADAGADLAWGRIFHVHGPGEDSRRLIPWVASQLRSGVPVDLTDGTQIRDHLHVADVASGLGSLLQPGASGIYNICSGEPVTLKTVLQMVAGIVGGDSLLRFGAVPRRPTETMFLAGDSTRLRALGWLPRFSLKAGLEDTLSSRT